MPNANPSPFARFATNLVSGLVSTAAQTFAGVKTFLALIVASAGIQVASLFNTNGTASGDRGVVVGFFTADGSVNADAKPLSAGTGVGGTYVEKMYVDKTGHLRLLTAAAGNMGVGAYVSGTPGVYVFGGGGTIGFLNSTGTLGLSMNLSTGAVSMSAGLAINGALTGVSTLTVGGIAVGTTGIGSTASSINSSFSSGWALTDAAATECFRFLSTTNFTNLEASLFTWRHSNVFTADPVARLRVSGRFDQSGTDDSANAGNRTVNKPTGTNKLANGASTSTITHSLCSATSRVMVTFHDDPGARYWVTRAAGSFTVNLSAAAGADKIFSWEVSNIL